MKLEKYFTQYGNVYFLFEHGGLSDIKQHTTIVKIKKHLLAIISYKNRKNLNFLTFLIFDRFFFKRFKKQ